MNAITTRLLSKGIEQVAGSGVGIDEDGGLCFPDGLTPKRVHRFIEIVLAQDFETPKSALAALFARVGVPSAAIEALREVLTDDASLDVSAIAKHPVALARSLPSVRQIPVAFRTFLVEGLGFATEKDGTLEEAVVSTRKGAARALGCKARWDAILAEKDGVGEIARGWRERSAP